MSNQAQEWPQTLDEAVGRLLDELPDKEKATLRTMSESDLINLHFSLGMYIRNAFGLWLGNDVLLVACSKEGNGFIDPDDASGVIIEALWKRVQTQG